MQEAYGSHKAFSFKLNSLENNNEVHIFESAIDLLSYATILKLEDIDMQEKLEKNEISDIIEAPILFMTHYTLRHYAFFFVTLKRKYYN